MSKIIVNFGEQKLNHSNPEWKTTKHSNMHKVKLLTWDFAALTVEVFSDLKTIKRWLELNNFPGHVQTNATNLMQRIIGFFASFTERGKTYRQKITTKRRHERIFKD